MVRSSPHNQNNAFADKWVEIGALIPMPPREPPIFCKGHISMGIYKRRSVPSKTMVTSAIKTLTRNPRMGVSLVAIKKYITENYGHSFSDVNNRFRFVKRYIKSSLEKGELVRTKGNGFAGSFRLPPTRQCIQKKTIRKTIQKKKKNAKQIAGKKSKFMRKQMQQQLQEAVSRTKVNSNVGGSEGEVGGAAESDVWSPVQQASVVKAVSKASIRKVRKNKETHSLN